MRRIRVVPHDPQWAAAFAREAAALREALGAVALALHHIGSTSVPGLAAKPVIDILLVVDDHAALDARNAAMQALGYEPRGEFGIPGRRYFSRGSDEARTHHVHAFEQSDPGVFRHIAFRDYLAAHPDEAAAYGRLKQELAQRFPDDIEAYMAGKDAMVKELERRGLAEAAGT